MIARALLNVAVGAGAFCTSAALVSSRMPVPEGIGLATKLEYLVEHIDEFDALAIGSSRVYRSVIPDIVDEGLGEAGISTRFFNLGIAGAEPWEVDGYLRRVLAAKPGGFRLVLFEAWNHDPRGLRVETFSRRRVHWHDLRQTLSVVRMCLAQEEWTLWRRLEESSIHARQFGWRLTSYGRGPEWFEDLSEPTRAPEWLVKERGYRPIGQDPESDPEQRRKEFLADPRVLKQRAEVHLRRAAGEIPSSVLDLELVREQVKLIQASGAIPVCIVGPCGEDAVALSKLRQVAPRLVHYQSPDEHPFLYDPAQHWDVNHLRRKGARRFSRVLARDLARVLQADG